VLDRPTHIRSEHLERGQVGFRHYRSIVPVDRATPSTPGGRFLAVAPDSCPVGALWRRAGAIQLRTDLLLC
jgi:hypothetical protein